MALHSFALGRRKCLDIRSIGDENGKAICLENIRDTFASTDENCRRWVVAHINDYGVVESVGSVRTITGPTVFLQVRVVLNAVFRLLGVLPERHFAQSHQGGLLEE